MDLSEEAVMTTGGRSQFMAGEEKEETGRRRERRKRGERPYQFVRC
jgi:hypothetical protein